MFSREFCELFKKDTYFVENLQTAGSERQCGDLSLKKLQAWRSERI